ncbi:uncharacterized protein BXIN_2097 [Babesia sp. Xinjiang]|uniref:uncharacterized protein n=1 Tax=Babesia sp. Xinjiang TaxID=462227 RepID=UPI000A25C09A|nr:uncharacterized protein BXIN_2097 [Babesia sp. Xinjiang]ORM40440.1 hypothetical protein BXIN_2097 [Babesia sp. Xinjiang]
MAGFKIHKVIFAFLVVVGLTNVTVLGADVPKYSEQTNGNLSGNTMQNELPAWWNKIFSGKGELSKEVIERGKQRLQQVLQRISDHTPKENLQPYKSLIKGLKKQDDLRILGFIVVLLGELTPGRAPQMAVDLVGGSLSKFLLTKNLDKFGTGMRYIDHCDRVCDYVTDALTTPTWIAFH